MLDFVFARSVSDEAIPADEGLWGWLKVSLYKAGGSGWT